MYFSKGCLGALDGTYVPLTVPLELQGRYHTRKGFNATNVLGVCSQDMRFIYILPGWEGSAANGRVLRDALVRPYPLVVPNGVYLLYFVHIFLFSSFIEEFFYYYY